MSTYQVPAMSLLSPQEVPLDTSQHKLGISEEIKLWGLVGVYTMTSVLKSTVARPNAHTNITNSSKTFLSTRVHDGSKLGVKVWTSFSKKLCIVMSSKEGGSLSSASNEFTPPQIGSLGYFTTQAGFFRGNSILRPCGRTTRTMPSVLKSTVVRPKAHTNNTNSIKIVLSTRVLDGQKFFVSVWTLLSKQWVKNIFLKMLQ